MKTKLTCIAVFILFTLTATLSAQNQDSVKVERKGISESFPIPSSDPLVIVDGRPIGNLSSLQIKTLFSNLKFEKIQDIVVPKSSSSAAIYGTRAANGIIVILTKGAIYHQSDERRLQSLLKE